MSRSEEVRCIVENVQFRLRKSDRGLPLRSVLGSKWVLRGLNSGLNSANSEGLDVTYRPRLEESLFFLSTLSQCVFGGLSIRASELAAL